jgi:hypothetical protein
MLDALAGLFESKNKRMKLALRNQLHCIMMTMLDSVSTYFIKVSQLRYQLKAIGDIVDDAKLVIVTLNGLPSSWESFVQSICGRVQLPKFDHFWTDCVTSLFPLACN